MYQKTKKLYVRIYDTVTDISSVAEHKNTFVENQDITGYNNGTVDENNKILEYRVFMHQRPTTAIVKITPIRDPPMMSPA